MFNKSVFGCFTVDPLVFFTLEVFVQRKHHFYSWYVNSIKCSSVVYQGFRLFKAGKCHMLSGKRYRSFETGDVTGNKLRSRIRSYMASSSKPHTEIKSSS
ncbi:unnamed protein product [Haemonchus placei]|uniref:Secreted protein n=1 Tax=Haemonchus placei TaxID=6290 RepID=A0A0N4WJP8_HAEPC|nr:unnamed protein product [Haemonchus placei]